MLVRSSRPVGVTIACFPWSVKSGIRDGTALALVRADSPWFLAPTVPVLVESLVSYRPQKFFLGQSVAIYPAVAVGSALILILSLSSWKLFGTFRAGAAGLGRPALAFGGRGS